MEQAHELDGLTGRKYSDYEIQEKVTWRTIETFNSILASYGSQDTPEIEALNTLLNDFHHLATTDQEKTVWTNFGFEFGVICLKILSAIERTDLFEDLFLKLLSVISVISEHDSDVWKAVARQILNVLINKKFSFCYLEKIVKVYVSILRKIEKMALNNFAHQNLSLLRSLSMLVRNLGDYETQVDFIKLVFLHVSDMKLIENFFFEDRGKVRDLFCSLRFVDFENDCRIYLNTLNKEENERRVLSIQCGILYLGGCFMEPPTGRKTIWLDANKISERLSLKCSNLSRERLVFIPHSSLQDIKIEKKNGSYSVTIKTWNLGNTHKEARNDDVFCVAFETDNTQEDVQDFVDFLEETIQKQKKKLKKLGNKLSQTCEDIFIDRIAIRKVGKRKVQDNAISSSVAKKPEVSKHLRSLHDETLEVETKNAWKVLTKPLDKIVPETRELISNSFVERFQSKPKDSRHTKNLLEILGKPLDKISPVEFVPKSQELSPNPFVQRVRSREPSTVRKPEVSRHPEGLLKMTLDIESKNKDAWEVLTGSSEKVVPETQELNTNSFVERIRSKESSVPKKPEVSRHTKNLLEVLAKPSDKISPVKVVPESQELSPKSFVQSLNKNLGLESPDPKHSFEDSLTTVEFLRTQNSSKVDHKLYRPTIFDFSQDLEFEKENEPPPIPPKKAEKTVPAPITRVLRSKKSLEPKILESHSEDYFRRSYLKRKKPSMPKLKKKSTKKKPKANKTNDSAKKKKSNLPPPPPSLLDPEGYAYQRWLRPTTSRRSNFWLEKLNAQQKPKPESTQVFDFSEESEGDKPKQTGRIPKPKRKKIQTKKNQTTMKEVKEILKVIEWKTSPKRTAPRRQKMKVSVINLQGNEASMKRVSTRNFQDEPPQPVEIPSLTVLNERELLPKNVEDGKEDGLIPIKPTNVEENAEDDRSISIRRTDVEGESENDGLIPTKPTDMELNSEEDKLVLTSDEEPKSPKRNLAKKRELSNEEISITRAIVKKKPKRFNGISIPPALLSRLQQVEKKARQQTEEIVEVVSKATNFLLDHLRRKDAQKTVKYLRSAEEAGLKVKELDDTETRARRIKRVVAYYEAGCSVHRMCESMDAQLSKVQDAVKDLTSHKSDSAKRVKRIGDRLKSVIQSEIDRTIQNELRSRQNRLLQYLKSGLGEFIG